MYGACVVADRVFSQAILTAMAGAFIAELGGGKIGVAWNDPRRPQSSFGNLENGARGAGIGAAIALVIVAIGLGSGALSRDGARSPLFFAMLAGLLESTLVAVKLEILQRGILRVLCNKTEPRAFLPLAALVGALAAAGAGASAMATGASLALCMALLWERHNGGLLPILAHTGVRFVLGPLTGAAGFALKADGPWIGAGLMQSPLAAVVLAVAAAVLFSRRQRPPRAVE